MQLSSNEIISKNKALRATNYALDQFVYRASHDLKVPANNIKSMVTLLKMKMKSKEAIVNEIVRQLEQNSQTLETTITDLLEMTKAEKIKSDERIWIPFLKNLKELLALFNNTIEETKN